MKMWKSLCAGTLALALAGAWSMAEDVKKEAKTVSGKSSCAQCDGVTTAKHEIMIVDKDGGRWVLAKDKDSKGYDAVHKARKEGKSVVAKYVGEPETKKDDSGKEYKVVKVSEVKVEEKA
jgi:hypothetical protein